jgi:cell division septation protein DedD
LANDGVNNAVGTEDARTTWAVAPPGTVFPPPKPKARPAEPASGVSGDILDGWVFVQAGIFSEPGNATRLVQTLRAADLLANEQPVTLGNRQFIRVLVGPYYTIAERDAALETVRRIGPADATPARG